MSVHAGEAVDMTVADKNFKQTFTVIQANPYAEAGEAKTVQVQILDLLFENQICSLVYMKEFTN